MLEVYDLNLRKTAILKNAYNVSVTRKLNAINTLEFTLPSTDYNVEYCKLFHYVKLEDDLYRIISPSQSIAEIGEITYSCEHVIATLLDDVLFGAYTIGNIGIHTDEVINWILDKQTTTRWVLDRCAFDFQYEYGWENENLLGALFGVPSLFVDPYIWRFDTTVFPWKISLDRIDTSKNPDFYIRALRNRMSIDRDTAAEEICTRLYCLGYGEGINQLGISDVNGGVPYLQAPQEYIDRYGLISRIWVDRSFEDAESLKARGEVLLAGYREPQISVKVEAADLYPMSGITYDKADLGAITYVEEENLKTFVTEISQNLDNPGDMSVTLSSSTKDLATTIADLADRQRIEATYSQGATQLYAQTIQGNADASSPLEFNFYIPEEMRIVNKVLAKIKIESFRTYSRATAGGGGSSQTSSSGGGTSSSTGNNSTQSETSGASSRRTTASGGQTTSGAVTNALYNSYNTTTPNRSTFDDHTHSVRLSVPSHKHTIGSHTHGMDHTHNFTLPSHTHNFNVPSHTHSVNIPTHTHNIEAGIFRFGSPSSFTIGVNGETRATFTETQAEINITDYLVGDDGKIARGSWQTIDILPNDLAYISVDMYVQGFIQSRGGSNV